MTLSRIAIALGEPIRVRRGRFVSSPPAAFNSARPHLAEGGAGLLLRLLGLSGFALPLELQPADGRQEPHRLRFAIDHGDLPLSHSAAVPANLRVPERRSPAEFTCRPRHRASTRDGGADPVYLSIAFTAASRNRILHEIRTFSTRPDRRPESPAPCYHESTHDSISNERWGP